MAKPSSVKVKLVLTQGAATDVITTKVLRRVLHIDNKIAASLAARLHRGSEVSLGTFEKGTGQDLRSKFKVAGVIAELRLVGEPINSSPSVNDAVAAGVRVSSTGTPPLAPRAVWASGAGVVAIIAALVVAAASTHNAATPHQSAAKTSVSVSDEYALAQMDAGGTPAPTQVAAFAARLDRLAAKCTNTRSSISNYAVVTRDLVKRQGRTATLAQVLDGMNASIPSNAPRMDCRDIAAGWATIYISGG